MDSNAVFGRHTHGEDPQFIYTATFLCIGMAFCTNAIYALVVFNKCCRAVLFPVPQVDRGYRCRSLFFCWFGHASFSFLKVGLRKAMEANIQTMDVNDGFFPRWGSPMATG